MEELVCMLRKSLPDVPMLMTTPPGSYDSFRQRRRRRTYKINPRTAVAAQTIRRFADADISVAVALPDGLITPIVRSANRRSIGDISNDIHSLITKARAGTLKPEEFQGGTFSVSNLGMFGIKAFSSIINEPQGAIMSVGAGEQRPVVKNGQLAVATVMTVTLTCDHRVVDGAIGAKFLAAFKPLIEEPLTLIV